MLASMATIRSSPASRSRSPVRRRAGADARDARPRAARCVSRDPCASRSPDSCTQRPSFSRRSRHARETDTRGRRTADDHDRRGPASATPRDTGLGAHSSLAMAIMAKVAVAILDHGRPCCYRRPPSRTQETIQEDETMTKTRIFLTGLAALFVAELLATLVHGFVLAADYEPYYGTLLRGGKDPAWQFAFLPFAHLAWVGGLVWVYLRVTFAGSGVAAGVKVGRVCCARGEGA